MTTITSAAPYLALLQEPSIELKSYALNSLNSVADKLWAEIANHISEIEEIYEDDTYPKANRDQAALLAAKIYYNLGDYDSSVKYFLLANDEFDFSEESEFVQTIVSKCLELYIKLSKKQYEKSNGTDVDFSNINSQLSSIFDKMLRKCVNQDEIKLALGICLESYRLDMIKSLLQEQIDDSDKSDDYVLNLINYLLVASTTTTINLQFRNQILNLLITTLLTLSTVDYFIITKVLVKLNDYKLVQKILKDLILSKDESNYQIGLQIAFDLVNVASQELLTKTIESIEADSSIDNQMKYVIKLKNILSGIPTCDFQMTFLNDHNSADVSILNKSKERLDGRNSIFHSAVTFENAFMFAGTSSDSFFRSNLEWLGKATNWSKFSATAALGVIHKGNFSHGRNVLQPYLPGNMSSSYTNGGSLYGLGLVYAGHGKEVLGYLRENVVTNTDLIDQPNIDIILHGACLGVGVAAMGLSDDNIYNELKNVLYSDSAIAGEAAALSMGLVMLGSGNKAAIKDMQLYAKETQHEVIKRGLSIGIALLCFGKELESEDIINKLINDQESILRYGGCFTIGLAYCGTSNNDAIKRLLHIAVSDSSDDVRRAAVMNLGFILIRDYKTLPSIVELLSESHNPHVRYGTAMALGIACAGKGLQAAFDVLEPLTKDSVDFVRQGALIATSMILIQQNDKTFPKVGEFKEKLSKIISNNREEGLSKFGAALSQGIIDASGRNVTIELENSQFNTLNMKAIVGMVVFLQHWYWFPFTHFLSLSFSPTCIIGIRDDLKIPNFKINCHTKPDIFNYPPKEEVVVEKQPDKIQTAVLSTTARAKAREIKKNKDKESKEKDSNKEKDASSPSLTKKESSGAVLTASKKDSSSTEVASTSAPELSGVTSSTSSSLYTKTPYQFDNMSRVMPDQFKYIAFSKSERFIPIRKFRNMSGIIILKDQEPGKPIGSRIKTIEEKNNNNAPLPDSFVIDSQVDAALFEDVEDEEVETEKTSADVGMEEN